MNRERYYKKWQEEFRLWAEARLGKPMDAIISNGIEHKFEQGATYCLKLSDSAPWGYIEGSVARGREIWRPSYRDANRRLDAAELVAACGGYFERPIWNMVGEQRYLAGIAMTAEKDIVPARIERIKPIRLARIPIDGTELGEIRVVFGTAFGTAVVQISIRNNNYVPPGCGRLAAGQKVALRLERFTDSTALLLAILDDRSIVEVW